MDNTELLFRAWHDYGYMTAAVSLEDVKNGFTGLSGDDAHVMQYIQKNDKNDKYIFTGDILKIRVSRHEGDGSHPNIHHGFYYLYSEVLDMRGNLRYNRDAIKELEKPMGKEVFTQWVSYDYRLFGDLYGCMYHKKDESGEYIVDGDNHGNWKRFYDFEIAGNIKETPHLMDSVNIMKVRS